MFDRTHFLGKYALITLVALLMLTLFDSNPWWKVLLYAIPTTFANVFLMGMGIQGSLPRIVTAFLQGVLAAFIAYIFGLTPFLRTTLGTLVGFALLLTVLEYLLARFFLPKTP
ncbi:MAG: hypothetical protein GX971_08215 [Firmicutes bacterium]|nr:hypothetical protein [Bacillota bacterium]